MLLFPKNHVNYLCNFKTIYFEDFLLHFSWFLKVKQILQIVTTSFLPQVPNVTACQVLSNMCVMSQYEITQRPCIDYNTLYDRASGSSSVDPPR